MPVLRMDKTTNCARVGNYYIRDQRLSLRGKGKLTRLLSLPDDWQHSVSSLADITKEGEATFRSALDELEQLGYLERRRRRDEHGRFNKTEYSIYEQQKDTFDLRSGVPYLDIPKCVANWSSSEWPIWTRDERDSFGVYDVSVWYTGNILRYTSKNCKLSLLIFLDYKSNLHKI